MGALLLAGLSIVLGVIGYGRVTAVPTEDITFVIEEGLPYGITTESVAHVMEARELAVFEPFVFQVTERELEWAEIYDGDIGEADILLSIGDDAEDRDLVLEDYTRVAFQQEDSGKDNYNIATEIRATFNNNRTLGHGPSAVVGAAMTAADLKYPGPQEATAWWVALSALPLLGAFWVMTAWLRDRRQERAWERRYKRARWQLAQTVLELDALEVRYETAQTPDLAPLWKSLRHDSLTLATDEHDLASQFLDHGYLSRRDVAPHEKVLEDFEQQATALMHRADALAGSAEVRAGHTGSRSVLDRIAKPIVQAIDELLAHGQRYPKFAVALTSQREELLALSQQASYDPAADAEELRRDHQQVLDSWRIVEDTIRSTAGRFEAHAKTGNTGMAAYRESDRTLQRDAEERLKQRIAAITAGHTESLARLRKALGLGYGTESGPGYALERVVAILAAQQLRSTPVPSAVGKTGTSRNIKVGAAAGLVIPLVVGALGGWIAVAGAEPNTSYGRTLTGDQPLHDLTIFGNPELLPTLEGQAWALEDEAGLTNLDFLTLPEIRADMQVSADRNDAGGLLPDTLDLTLAIVPIEDYTTYHAHPDHAQQIEIDYADLLAAQQQLKHDVAQQNPALLDPVTGEIVLGQALMPLWILPDGRYAMGGIMTGEISWGIDSRLGTYFFNFTEPRVAGDADDTLLTLNYLTYDLERLARNMEYNHQRAAHHDPVGLFWTVALAVWAAVQTLLFLGVAIVASSRRFENTVAARKQLENLERQLEKLAIGLDLSRLDMVAVLGSHAVSSTGGDAELADQRLYESTLVTAWRQVQDLQSTPRRAQRGDAWIARVGQVQRLVDIMATRELTVTQRAAAVLRDDAQREEHFTHHPEGNI